MYKLTDLENVKTALTDFLTSLQGDDVRRGVNFLQSISKGGNPPGSDIFTKLNEALKPAGVQVSADGGADSVITDAAKAVLAARRQASAEL